VSKECCWQPNGTLKPAECDTRPKPPKTGYSNPGCYAAILKDCSVEISKEHYISRSALEKLTDNRLVNLRGLPWIDPGGTRSLPFLSLESRILCVRHNNALSPIDAVGSRLFDTMINENEDLMKQYGLKSDSAVLFNGHDIEKFLIKIMLGVMASGNMKFTLTKEDDVMNKGKWIRTLFGQGRVAGKRGLYFVGMPGTSDTATKKEMEISGLSNRRLGLHTFLFTLQKRRLLLSLTADPTRAVGIPREALTHHPWEILTTDGTSEKSILLGWDSQGELGTTVWISFR
jgi:hypothetical protein